MAKRNMKVFWKCGGRCYYCGIQLDPANWHAEHVVPKGHGGSGALKNLVGSCPPCNRAKKSRTPAEFKEWRRKQMQAALKLFHTIIDPLLAYTDPTIGEEILSHVEAIQRLEPLLDLTFYGETCNPHEGLTRSQWVQEAETEREQ